MLVRSHFYIGDICCKSVTTGFLDYCSSFSALDAYCLIEVYDVLCRKVDERRLDVNVEPTGGHTVKPRKTKMERKQQRVAERQDQDHRTRFTFKVSSFSIWQDLWMSHTKDH